MPSYKDWKRRLEETSDNETSFSVESNPIPMGERWCAQRIAAMDDTSGVDAITFAVRRVGYDHVFDYVGEKDQSVWHIIKDPLYLVAGEKLKVTFVDANVGDKVKVHVTGYKEKVKG